MPILLALAAFILAPGLSRTSSSVLLGVVQSHALTARAFAAPRKRRYHRLARVYPLVLCGRTARPRRQTQASRSVLSTQLRLLKTSLDHRAPFEPESRLRTLGLNPGDPLSTSPPSNRGWVPPLFPNWCLLWRLARRGTSGGRPFPH